MAKELKRVMVASELMARLERVAHEKAKATANYDEVVEIIKATVKENESVVLHSERNGLQATMTVKYNFDKEVLSEEDAKRIATLESEIKAIKAKYSNTKKVVSIGNIK